MRPLLLIASLISSDAIYPTPPDLPRFILVTQYFGSVSRAEGDLAWSEPGWVQNITPVDTVEDAIKMLTGHDDTYLVGLWRLDEHNRVSIKHRAIVHPKKTRVVDESWVEHKWEPLAED